MPEINLDGDEEEKSLGITHAVTAPGRIEGEPNKDQDTVPDGKEEPVTDHG